MEIIGPLFLVYSGFVALALTAWQQRNALLPHLLVNNSVFWALRSSGCLALIMALYLSINAFGMAIGITAWVACATLSGLTLSLLCVYQPRFALCIIAGNIISIMMWPENIVYTVLPLLPLFISFLLIRTSKA